MKRQSDRFADSRGGLSRRQMLSAGLGFGALAWGALQLGQKDDRIPAVRRRAQSVVWLFMRGGFSHMETFDPKPALGRYAGKTISETPYKHVQDPEKFKNVRVVVVNDENGRQRDTILPPQTGFKKYGESGIEVSDLFPHLGRCVDDLAIIRSMWTTDNNHGAELQFQTGRHILDGSFPTVGAWATWGLGRLSDNLPQFITMGPHYYPREGDYLGPAYDAVPLSGTPGEALAYQRPALRVSTVQQQMTFDLARRLNRIAAKERQDDDALFARMRSYELAFRMQTSVPEAVSLKDETKETQNLYGFDNATTSGLAGQLLVARRLIERGVRFIQIFNGTGANGQWDAHVDLKKNHAERAAAVDLPIAGFLTDLKRRGLLQQTIVVFATEFGRTPGSQKSDGRDHHPFGFSIWMAGGGIKGGIVHGATDEIGFHAVEHRHYVTDVHATILTLLGLNPHKLELPGHKRLELEFGNPIREIMS